MHVKHVQVGGYFILAKPVGLVLLVYAGSGFNAGCVALGSADYAGLRELFNSRLRRLCCSTLVYAGCDG